jgi:hypothetical protein
LYSVELIVLRDHTNRVCGVAATVYRREQDPRQFGQKLDSEDSRDRERLAERHTEDRLARGEGPGLSTELLDRELGPCEGFLARASTRTRGKLESFSIPR